MTDPVAGLLLTDIDDAKAGLYPVYENAEDRLPVRIADETMMPSDPPEPDCPLHLTALAEVQAEDSQVDLPTLIAIVASATEMPLP
jgi:hypothetical protein